MNFQEKLTNLMKDKNISQKELAKRIGIDETAMSRYVNGSRTPRIDILANLARELDVTIEYLVGEGEEDYEYKKLKNLICRNVHEMSDSQRLELMEILSRKARKWNYLVADMKK